VWGGDLQQARRWLRGALFRSAEVDGERPDAGQEIIALGNRNVFIVQLGRKAVAGSFEDFVETVSSADLAVNGLKVEYDAPELGRTTFDWESPLVVDGSPIPLRDYARWDNPYTKADFDSTHYLITFQDKSLDLEFENGTRTIK
jgi:hypothetical protein